MSEEFDPYRMYPEVEIDRRVRYYDGQFLRSGDFIDAQRYDIDRHRRHLEATVTPGVVAGLDVTASTDQVTVAAGAAIDARGRQIVLIAAEQKVIPAADRGKNLVLYIAYAEEPANEAEGGQGTAGATRFHERPTIAYVIDGTAPPGHAIVIATLQVDVSGHVTAESQMRMRAGLRVPGPTPLTLTAREIDPGRGTLDGALHLRVPAGTAHSPATPALRVDGHGMLTGGLVVGQDGVAGYQGIANEGDDLIVRGRLAAGGAEGSALYKLGVGYASPAQGEGTLTAQRVGIGRQDIGAGLVADVQGSARISGGAEIGGALAVGAGLAVGGTLGVTGDATVAGHLDVTQTLDVIGATTVGGALTVTGAVENRSTLTVNGTILASGRKLDLGHNVSGREVNAGKIEYGTFDGGALCIIGAGTTNVSRRVRIWAEGGLGVEGPATATGQLTGGSLRSNGQSWLVGAVTTESSFEAYGNGVVRGRLLVGQTSTTGYGGVGADSNDLIVNGQFSAAGSAGSAIYGLGIGTAPIANREGYLLVRQRLGVGMATEPATTLDVTGTARVTGHTDLDSSLTVDGTVTLNGAVISHSAVTTHGAIVHNGAVTSHGTVTANARLNVAAGADNGIWFPENAYGGGGDWARLRLTRQGDTGEDTRLELGTGNDANDIIVLNQKSTDLVVLRNGKVGIGIGTAEPSQMLQVGGNVEIDGTLRVDGKTIDLAAWDTREDANSGQIKYRVHTSNALELLGGRPTGAGSRRIKAWAEGGFDIEGFVTVYGDPVPRTRGSSVRIVWGAVYSSGAKWVGDGFSVGRYGNNAGVFSITFDVAFSSRPTVIASQHYPNDNDGSDSWGDTRDNAIVARVFNSWCQVVTGSGSGDRTWRSFEFIAIGPV